MNAEPEDGPPAGRGTVVAGAVIVASGVGWFALSHLVMGTATGDAMGEALGVMLAMLVVGSVVGAVTSGRSR